MTVASVALVNGGRGAGSIVAGLTFGAFVAGLTRAGERKIAARE